MILALTLSTCKVVDTAQGTVHRRWAQPVTSCVMLVEVLNHSGPWYLHVYTPSTVVRGIERVGIWPRESSPQMATDLPVDGRCSLYAHRANPLQGTILPFSCCLQLEEKQDQDRLSVSGD